MLVTKNLQIGFNFDLP